MSMSLRHGAHPRSSRPVALVRILSPLRELPRRRGLGGVVLLAGDAVAALSGRTRLVGVLRRSVDDAPHDRDRRARRSTEDLRHWINDGLMTVFFFVVGLEIKRELVRGELRDPRAAALPVSPRVGGMVVPALAVPRAQRRARAGGRRLGHPDGDRHRLRRRRARRCSVAACRAALQALPARPWRSSTTSARSSSSRSSTPTASPSPGSPRRRHRRPHRRDACGCGSPRPVAYIVPAIALWVCVFESGIHATIAGVVARPAHSGARRFGGAQSSKRLEHRLHPWSSFADRPAVRARQRRRLSSGRPTSKRRASPITLGHRPRAGRRQTARHHRRDLHRASAPRLGRLPDRRRAASTRRRRRLAGIGFTVSLVRRLTVASPAYSSPKQRSESLIVSTASADRPGILILVGAPDTRATTPQAMP